MQGFDRADQTFRVLVADSRRLSLDLLGAYLCAAGLSVTVAEGVEACLQAFAANGPFDVAVVDLGLCGSAGAAGLRRFSKAAPDCRVAVIADAAQPRLVDNLFEAGAAGLLLRSMPARSIVSALRFMREGERFLPPDLLCAHVADPGPRDLSAGEMRVLNCLSQGRPNKGIASDLRLAEPTVKMHVTAICRKLGAQNRTQAAVMARAMGLV